MNKRLEQAVAAFSRQEFSASVSAVIGFLDILIEDAKQRGAAIVGIFLNQVAFVYGTKLTTAATVALVFGTMPILTALFAEWVLRKKYRMV